ncbi:hypothetical protein O181_119008 [Austropuccinia psidii MF-1]|uniref:Uncharacterized protein n=1 Tax=Austropuccinia psidii MF-1 TaxID=1389203 RepID=A0A9Q3KDA7_9BASI|nr:hypothetical protein [Austropuccinia psidii MF-1]
MNPQGRSYGLGYSDLINIFSTEEVEELLFGYPSSPSRSTTFWDWVNNPHSTPPLLQLWHQFRTPPPRSLIQRKFQKPQWLSTLLSKANAVSREECTPTIYAPVIPMDGLLQPVNYLSHCFPLVFICFDM